MQTADPTADQFTCMQSVPSKTLEDALISHNIAFRVVIDGNVPSFQLVQSFTTDQTSLILKIPKHEWQAEILLMFLSLWAL